MHYSTIALAATLSVASAAVNRGFNYGAVTREGAMKNEASFTAEFKAAKGLANTSGAFSSARLYTMIQSGTTNTPISAIPAAIATDTRLFLGLWASAGQENIDNEIAALTSAISTYGEKFTSRVNGISVGSEDLYRISPTGLKNDPTGVGAQPADLVKYIGQVKKALQGTALSSVPVGHVDTWDVWRNNTNSPVIDAADFLGMNTFPYFQTTEDNSIENAPTLFKAAYDITTTAAKGKPVIVTETGWPVSGKDAEKGQPSKANARSYYEAVGCNTLFGKVETYWYTLVDANTAVDSQPQFGIVGTTISTNSLFDLTCDPVKNVTSSSATKSGSATGSATGTASGSASATGSATGSMTILPISTGATTASSPTGTGAAGGSGSGSGSGSGTGSSPASGTSSGTGPTVTANAASSIKAASSVIALFGAVAAYAALI